MLKFGCSSLKNNQSYVMKIRMTSESPIVSPSEKGVINYYLHHKICTVICGNAIFTMGYSRKNPHPPNGWGPFLTPPLTWIS